MASSPFEEWVCGVLEAAGVDGEVYGGYISGSLATIEGSLREEIEETIQDILSGSLVTTSISGHVIPRMSGLLTCPKPIQRRTR